LVMAAFIKPSSYFLPLFIAPGLAIVCMHKMRVRWQAPMLYLAICVLFIGGWQVRNFAETGFPGFSSVTAKNLYFFQAAGVKAEIEGRPLDAVQKELGYGDEADYLRAHPEQARWTQGERATFEQKEAVRVLREDTVQALELQLKGAVVVAFTPCAADFLRMVGEEPEDAPERVVGKSLVEEMAGLLREHLGVAMAMVFFELILLGIYWFAAVSFWRGSMGKKYKVLFAGLILYFVLVSGGMQAVGRYRAPVMPFACILAAGAVVSAGNRLTQKRY
jgi:hypothetical protein